MENINERVELEAINKAFNRRLYTFNITNKVKRVNIEDFLNDAFLIYESEVSRFLNGHSMIKSMTVLAAEFEKNIEKVDENLQCSSTSDGDVGKIKQTLYFTSPSVTIGLHNNLKEHFQNSVVSEIMNSVENVAIRGSGFSLAQILHLNVQISAYNPLRGSSYIETPKKLEKKKALVNVKNNDEMCFKWAILSALYPQATNANRVSHYKKYKNELNFDNIPFPVTLKNIDKFELQNVEISVNVYYYDSGKDCVQPLRVTNAVKRNHIHLLLLHANDFDDYDGDDEDCTLTEGIKLMLESDEIYSHYCWITNLSRLVSSQLSKYNHRHYICDRCLNFYTNMQKLECHMKNCVNECQIEMPNNANKWIQFKNHQNQLKVPFIVYADTEAILRRIDSKEERANVFNEDCSTYAYQEHIVYSVGYYFKCEFDNSLSYYACSGNNLNCIDWFISELKSISKLVGGMLSQNVPMENMSLDEERDFHNLETVCSICHKPFTVNDVRARDHCHFTGKYRGPAHTNCNLNYKESRTIPVVMHNLSGYDAHLFIKKLAMQMKGDISIIPNNAEQYISFTKIDGETDPTVSFKERIKLKFIDSCRFMPSSLSTLASFLPTEKKCVLYAECLKDHSPELVAMLERKGVFPYDYVDSIERLGETTLPSQAQFYSELNEDEIDDEEYKFACEIWAKFQIKTLGEYSELYLKTDVLLLADVFENFRDICHKIYNLDPAHYYTSPGLSFDAMLKYTGVKIELITDVEMLLFVERGIRGGISQCSKRHVKANNKYMKANYDPSKKTNFLMYLDGEFILLHFFR